MFQLFPRQEYQTLNKVWVNRDAIEQNHHLLQVFHPEAQVCPVLKSNAYGHGLTTSAHIFDSLGCPFIAVDSLFEAYELLKTGIKTKILILGYTHPDNFKVKKLPFEFAVYDLELARTLDRYQPGCGIHLFVDTGMSREGIQVSQLPTFLKEISKLKNIKVSGLASHFADADNPSNETFNVSQIQAFKQALTITKKHGFEPQWRHISASGGSFKTKDNTFNMIRAGLAHYGINPLEKTDPAYEHLILKPALKFTSTIVQIKEIEKGERVGYNGTFTAKNKMKIGLLPAGYYEGVDRRLSNKGFVKVNDTFCQILGRVSMNMTTIDLSAVDSVRVGDEALIYSDNSDDKNSLVSAAATAQTIPYELLVHLAESIKRVDY